MYNDHPSPVFTVPYQRWVIDKSARPCGELSKEGCLFFYFLRGLVRMQNNDFAVDFNFWLEPRPTPGVTSTPAVRRSTPSSIPCCDRGRSRSDLQGSTFQMPRSPTAKFAVRSVSHRKFGVFPCGYFFSRTATSASSSQIGKHKKDYRSKQRLHIRVSR